MRGLRSRQKGGLNMFGIVVGISTIIILIIGIAVLLKKASIVIKLNLEVRNVRNEKKEE
jgi:hypothetical protein